MDSVCIESLVIAHTSSGAEALAKKAKPARVARPSQLIAMPALRPSTHDHYESRGT
jgi:hypothetical protein